ncbi:MAG: DUF1611 domain-containing protein [Candidatus Eremiobacteraeota bacterium]|nr:DUF1611 domain-containing protein [Candidatus Eremiobacteraeota bacterium]
MRVGEALLDLARADGIRSLFVVGTGKNVGKTVTTRAVAEAALQRGLRFGLTSLGRDGEAVDVTDASSKPRLFLRHGALIATARDVLPRAPASELVELSPYSTAAGPLVYARIREPGFFEIVGPPTASAIRSVVARMRELDCEQTIVDGAIDRVAAVAGGSDAVIVCAGASGAGTMTEAVDEVHALVKRLTVPAYDPAGAHVRVAGALTAALAARHASLASTGMQIVVRDPTQIAITGKALLGMMQQLDVRCERPLRVVAATVASIGRERYFEPRAFLQDVARATGLPVFDVYAAQAA